jgi:hypothetical protein
MYLSRRQVWKHDYVLVHHVFESSLSHMFPYLSTGRVQHTSPELQHEFCALWNQIVQDGNYWEMSFEILGRIRNIYLALHKDTDSVLTQFSASTRDEDDILWERSSYPVCKVPGHCSDSTLHIYDDASVASALAVLHARAKTAFVPSFLTHRPHAPDPTSVPANAPLRVQECFTNAPPLDDNASVSFWTQTATEARSSSPNPVTTGATRRTLESSTRMTHLPALKSSAFTVPPKSNASTSLQDAVTVEHPTVGHTSSTVVELPSSPSPTPVQDDFLPIGMLLRLVSALTRSKHTSFFARIAFSDASPRR